MKVRNIRTFITILYIVGIVFAVFGFGIGSVYSSEITVTYPEERKAAVNKWIDCGRRIAIQTFDHEAYEIIDFLSKRSIIVAPVIINGRSATQIITETKSKEFMILLWLKEDRRLSISFQRKFDQILIANYHPDNKALQIKNKNISDIWKGLIILHEGKHVKESIKTPYNWRDPMVYSQYERDAHIFQNRLAMIIGGEAYKVALEYEIARIESALKETKEFFGKIVGVGNYNKMLDKAFGPAQSKDEIDIRQTATWIDAYFHVIDKRYGKEGKEIKALFLKRIYQQGGIIK